MTQHLLSLHNRLGPLLPLVLAVLFGALAGWFVTRWLVARGARRGPAETPGARAAGGLASPPLRDEGIATTAPGMQDLGATVPAALAPTPGAPRADQGAAPDEVDPAATTTHMQALLLLQQGKLDSAWARLEQLPAALGEKSQALLEPLDRLATRFEQARRYDKARAVYERMAEIDPDYRDVKPRLVRARGLALNVAATNSSVQPAAAPQLTPMTQLGRFIVEREIGRGAMGAIYLGRDPNVDRPVAIKTLALSKEFEGPDLEEARARFFREAQMAGRLEHPDIVAILDSGEQDGLAFIAMEYVDGEDLSKHAQPGTLLPLRDLVPVMARVAEALSYAHTRGVTHRDVKPANIMINAQAGVVKIMDFGVARLSDSSRTRTGMVLGTPSFMSPEQLAGQRIDGRSDIYSLGVTLFQLLTGRLPFENKSMALLMRAIANEPAPDVRTLRPEIPESLANVVAIALEKRPEVRYADGRQLAQDLRAIALPEAVA